MPMYDRLCLNNHELIDCWEPVEFRPVPCKICGAVTERVFIGKPAGVIADEIPGGVWIRHGLCDPVTGAPVKYYSKSEMAAEAKRRGLVNAVRHAAEQGSDKSAHTTRWVAPPTITEEERLKNWYAHEETLRQGQASGSDPDGTPRD